MLYNNDMLGVRFAVFICGTRPWDIAGKRRLESSDFVSSHERLDSFSDAPDNQQERGSLGEGATLRRIWVPTAHIHGKNDEWLEDSRSLFAMCEPRSSVAWEHTFGHTIPVDRKNTAIMADVIRAVIRRANCNN